MIGMGNDEWAEKSLLGWEDFLGVESHWARKSKRWEIFPGFDILGKQKRWDAQSLRGWGSIGMGSL